MAEVPPDRATDPAGFLLAVADLREARIAVSPDQAERWVAVGGWVASEVSGCTCGSGGEFPHEQHCGLEQVFQVGNDAVAEYVAAEANPVHARAEVALWRGVAGRHRENLDAERPEPEFGLSAEWPRCTGCVNRMMWPCPDLVEALDAAAAYLDGAGQ